MMTVLVRAARTEVERDLRNATKLTEREAHSEIRFRPASRREYDEAIRREDAKLAATRARVDRNERFFQSLQH